jgi:DNA-binding beta-propeller fold protein YncE
MSSPSGALADVMRTSSDVGLAPFGVAVTPDGSKVYVTNLNNTVSVIAPPSFALPVLLRFLSQLRLQFGRNSFQSVHGGSNQE